MKVMIKHFVREGDGATDVEYVLLLAFVALVMVVSDPTVEAVVSSIWSTIATQLSTAAA